MLGLPGKRIYEEAMADDKKKVEDKADIKNTNTIQRKKNERINELNV